MGVSVSRARAPSIHSGRGIGGFTLDCFDKVICMPGAPWTSENGTTKRQAVAPQIHGPHTLHDEPYRSRVVVGGQVGCIRQVRTVCGPCFRSPGPPKGRVHCQRDRTDIVDTGQRPQQHARSCPHKFTTHMHCTTNPIDIEWWWGRVVVIRQGPAWVSPCGQGTGDPGAGRGHRTHNPPTTHTHSR